MIFSYLIQTDPIAGVYLCTAEKKIGFTIMIQWIHTMLKLPSNSVKMFSLFWMVGSPQYLSCWNYFTLVIQGMFPWGREERNVKEKIRTGNKKEQIPIWLIYFISFFLFVDDTNALLSSRKSQDVRKNYKYWAEQSI